MKVKGGKMMKVACYADDAKEPEMIGETDVDLTEVLTKGETDEWFTLNHKGKFAGKVYLELTFWSNVRVGVIVECECFDLIFWFACRSLRQRKNRSRSH